jgi:hypothetical protein
MSLNTYIIKEHATYYLKAESEEQAEEKFLAAISLTNKEIQCVVSEREVYEGPENREVST